MKRTRYLFCLLLLLLGAMSCKKDTGITAEEKTTKYPPPYWKADDTGKYPASMTAVVAIPVTLQGTADEKDQLAAFINDECRGEGVRVNVGTTTTYFVLIRGLADEESKVVFKYYCARSSFLYQTDPLLNFAIDDVYGNAQNPKIIFLNQVK